MSIMDLFRQAPVQTVAAPAQAAAPTPGQIPTTPTAVANAGAGDAPLSAANPPAVAAADVKSPLDEFAELWKNPATGATPNTPAPMFNLDPTKLLEAAKRIDFSNAVTPEQLTAISKGGEEATAAFVSAMQGVAATTLMHSAVTTGNMVEKAVNQAKTDWIKDVPGLVKGLNLREATATENPGLSHPAMKPVVDALQSQFQVKFPQASTTELRGMVSKYLDGMAGVLKPATKSTGASSQGGNDWEKFLTD